MYLPIRLRSGREPIVKAGLFVTGTDTRGGKTVVAAGLLYTLREAGLNAAPMKPVQTGGALEEGRLVSPDLRFCLKTCDMKPSADDERLMNPYCFQMPCSPHLAARMEGARVEIGAIQEWLQELLLRYETVIVEGAGGVLAPINESETMLDMMQALRLPVVVVAKRSLGTINHTLLSLQALREAGVEVLGVIFNEIEYTDEHVALDNEATIRRLGKIDILGSLGVLHGESESETIYALRRQFGKDVPGWRAITERLRSS